VSLASIERFPVIVPGQANAHPCEKPPWPVVFVTLRNSDHEKKRARKTARKPGPSGLTPRDEFAITHPRLIRKKFCQRENLPVRNLRYLSRSMLDNLGLLADSFEDLMEGVPRFGNVDDLRACLDFAAIAQVKSQTSRAGMKFLVWTRILAAEAMVAQLGYGGRALKGPSTRSCCPHTNPRHPESDYQKTSGARIKKRRRRYQGIRPFIIRLCSEENPGKLLVVRTGNIRHRRDIQQRVRSNTFPQASPFGKELPGRTPSSRDCIIMVMLPPGVFKFQAMIEKPMARKTETTEDFPFSCLLLFSTDILVCAVMLFG